MSDTTIGHCARISHFHKVMPVTIESLLREAETLISRFESELLLSDAIEKPRTFVLAHPEYHLSQKEVAQFKSHIVRRTKREPVAYIVGHKEFYGREFLVNEHTLIPRPETELLIEAVLQYTSDVRHIAGKTIHQKHASILIVDIGTGSGNIITTLAKELATCANSTEDFSFIATDISEDALAVAKNNANRWHTQQTIQFIHSNLLENIPKEKFFIAKEIIIIANLPYLSTQEFLDAPIDVRQFEPRSALESRTDGLDHYRRLLEELRDIFKEHKKNEKATLFLEISPSQETSVQTCIRAIFPKAKITIFRDLAQKHRLVKISLNASEKIMGLKKEK